MKIKALSSPSFHWFVLAYIILGCTVVNVAAWSNEEFEMFDLVEEIGENFYEVLGISQDAGDKEVRQAYRKLSVKLHPDKNPREDAEVKFRQLVGIYEVLRNKELRESYDRVLVDGLPNWRQPMFYFRRARKLALWQVGLILLGIISLGQYLAGWAAYFEKRLSMKEQIEARLRKTHRTKKGQKEGPTVQELEEEMERYLPKPSLWNLAPFQILRGIKYLILQFPKDVLEYREQLRLQKEEELRLAALEEERLERERLKAEEAKKPRKRKTFQPPERAGVEDAETQPIWNTGGEAAGGDQQRPKAYKPPPVSGGLWTDDDLTELARLCSKFPGGTPGRWEKIAEFLNRPVPEVTFMAKKVLEKLASKSAEEEESEIPQVKSKVKTKGGKADAIAATAAQTDSRSVENWSVEEQKALEHALQCYPKGAIERWDKIAKMVPNRSKEECMLRFKYVAEKVKKKKEKETLEVVATESEPPQAEEPSKTKPDARKNEPEAPKIEPETPIKSAAPPDENVLEEPGWEETKKTKKSKNKARAKAETKVEQVDSPVEEVPIVEFVAPEPVKVGPSKKKKSKSPAVPEPNEEPQTSKICPVTISPSVETEKVLTPIPIAQPSDDANQNDIRTSAASSVVASPAVEVDSIASQLQSLVEESFKEVSTEDEPLKESVCRTDSKSSSSEEIESIVIVRGEKDNSVERKNSSSSDNDWCVVDESDGN